MSGYQQESQQESEQGSETTTETTNDQDNILSNSEVQEMLGFSEVPSGLRRPYDSAYEANAQRTPNMRVGLSEEQMRDMERFLDNWNRNKNRYQTVATATNMPAELIAALHWRESSGNFNTYLHQGDPLGRPAVHVPTNIPIFYEWEDAAIHAINMKDSLQDQLEITQETRNPNAIATYAEAYNGLGYHNRNQSSPYVFAGTDQYSSGKYVGDGVFRQNVVDQQLGVMPMVGALGGLQTQQDMSPQGITPEFAWQRVLSGARVLRRNDYGLEVEALQIKLQQLGYEVTPDGDFGNGTRRIVIQFQTDHQLGADGVVGAGTASKIEEALRNMSSTPAPATENTPTIE